MGQARRFSLEKQKGNPGAASVPLGPSGHPKLSDGRVAAGDGARLAAVGANSATVAVSSPALSAPVRRAAGPARRQTSEIQVVLKRCRKRRSVIIRRAQCEPRRGLAAFPDRWIDRAKARRKYLPREKCNVFSDSTFRRAFDRRLILLSSYCLSIRIIREIYIFLRGCHVLWHCYALAVIHGEFVCDLVIKSVYRILWQRNVSIFNLIKNFNDLYKKFLLLNKNIRNFLLFPYYPI